MPTRNRTPEQPCAGLQSAPRHTAAELGVPRRGTDCEWTARFRYVRSPKAVCLLRLGAPYARREACYLYCCSHAHNHSFTPGGRACGCRYSWALRRRSGRVGAWDGSRGSNNRGHWPERPPSGAAARGRSAARACAGSSACGCSASRPAPAPAAAAEEQHPIPPSIEGPAIQAQGGGYCFGGPHPAPGGGWEAVQNPHTHNYAPFDLRLFAFREGCYYFVGDPRDFGFTGQTYNYYGAHPIHDHYGGGWCFMVGGHYHWWRPWSPYFTVVGPWYYWHGAYSPFFWSYWPYYSYYYRSYYPSYYAGGRYFNGYRVAPVDHARSTDRLARPRSEHARPSWRDVGWNARHPRWTLARHRTGDAGPGSSGRAWRRWWMAR